MAKFKQLYEQWKPNRWYSWQTALGLSGISGFLSILAKFLGKPNGFVASLLATLGWFFLISAITWWVTTEVSSRFAPWITGAVLCLFFFGSYDLGGWHGAIIVWPVVSATIFALPHFWDDSFKKKIPTMKERINIALILGTQLLMSFWIQFFVVLTDFVQEYPSYGSDDLSGSLFIVRSPIRRQEPRGVFILELLDRKLADDYEGKPWAETEAEFLNDPSATTFALYTQIMDEEITFKEDQYWRLQDPALIPADAGQKLVLRYDWTGPQAKLDDPYYIEKVCNLQSAPNPDDPQAPPITAINCEPSQVTGWLGNEQ